MNQKEEADAIVKLTGQVNKAKAEILDKLKKLQDIIDAGDAVSPEVTAALAELTTAVQGVDDVVPDAEPPTA